MDKYENKIINNKYRIIKKIGEGGMSVVYLAEDITNEKNKFAVKFLKNKNLSGRIEDIIRFRNEADIVMKLDHPNILKLYEIGEYEDQHCIIMEYIDGGSLHELLKEGHSYNEAGSIEIISQVCKALEQVHNANVIHRDIKPWNIMMTITKEKDQKKRAGINKINVKVIDFGLAQLRDFTKIEGSEEVVGTFGYMSPEQSGIIRRSVDERSDLYSLGVIFYQLITGELPFRGDSVSSIIHQHIAQIPNPPVKVKPNTSKTIERIILKLLEKEPEKRYQSASGILSDLERYKNGERDFELGINDKFIRLNFRTNLIGMDKELDSLKKMFDEVAEEKGRICLISGHAGIGKSRLVEELRDHVYSNAGLFIDGKCFSGESKVPYGPFKDALNIYLNIYGKYSEKKKLNIKEKIKNSVGELGEIILKLNPMMKEIISECPPLVELEPDRENKRFLMVAGKFFQDMGRIENGLVIMLDDLHWSDEGSIELLNEIVQDVSKVPLLIIGTYRDNEVIDEHGIIKLIENSKKNNYPVKEINIDYFNKDRMSEFVSNILHEKGGIVEQISGFILGKSKGNPFFATEILMQLVVEEAIFRDKNKWNIDHNILNKMEISSQVVNIVLKRISLLNEKEIDVLSLGAVIGRKFYIDLLFKVCNYDKKDIVEVVDKAISLQLLEEDLQEKGKILFVHDRIKEAFYTNIDKAKKKQLHQKIANTIETTSNTDDENIIFDLAYHYNNAEDNEKTITYSYPSGIKSKENYANEEAIKYFTVVKDILEEKGKKGNEQWIDVNENIGEIYLLIGKPDEAIEIFNSVLPFVENECKKAIIYKHISKTYLGKGDFYNCEKYSKIGLKLLGEKLPAKKLIIIFDIIKELIVHILHNIFPYIFIKNKKNIKKKDKIIVNFFSFLNLAFSLNEPLKGIRSILRSLNFSESKIGKSKELGMAICYFANLCMYVTLFKKALKYHEKGLKLREELNDKWGVGESLFYYGLWNLWTGHYRKSIEYLNKGIHIFGRIGDIKQITLLGGNIYHSCILSGEYEKAKAINDKHYEKSAKINDNFGLSAALAYYSKYYLEKGDLEEAYKYALESYNLSYKENISLFLCESSTYLANYFIEKSNIKKSLEHLQNAKKLHLKYRLLPQYIIHLYNSIPEAYISEYLMKKVEISKKEKKQNIKKIKKSCKEAINKTKKWASHYGGALRVNAKYYALTGKNKKAEQYFLQSIEHCKRIERKYELAKGLYEYGIFLKQINRDTESKEKLESAYRIFKEIDSKVYLMRTSDLLGITEEITSTERLMERQRLSSIIKVSQDISSILNLDELLDNVMSKAVEVTGAQRGYIFIHNDKTKKLEVRASKGITGKSKEDYLKNAVDDSFNNTKTIISADAEKDKEFLEYEGVSEKGLKSILSVPIKHGDKVTGVCYLDNQLSSGVFKEEDGELLNVFMSQVAICIENAIVYEEINKINRTLGKIVEERTRELMRINKELEEKNKFKSKYLANMSHEIRTPLNAIIGNNDYLLYSKELMTDSIIELNDKILTTIEKDNDISIFKEVRDYCLGLKEMIFKKDYNLEYYYYFELEELFKNIINKKNEKFKKDIKSNKIVNEIKEVMKEIKEVIDQETNIQKNNLKDISKSSKYLLDLINSILDISKIETGKTEIKYEQVNIEEFIEDIYKESYAYKSAKNKGQIELIKKINKNVPEKAIFDKNRIKEVLLNFLSNAIKFTEKGRISLIVDSDDICLIFKVKDTGIGIKKEDMKILFKEFGRISPSGKVEGTGLGLAISKKIINLHHGEIKVKSKYKEGSEFSVHLPFEKRKNNSHEK